MSFDSAWSDRDRSFPSTIWSQVLAAGDLASPERQAGLSELLDRYWKPVYVYVRTAWRASSHDARDLTQAFFAHLLEKGYLERLRPEKGSFRGYLKRALKHFLIDASRRDRARRPAGGRVVSLDAAADLDALGPAAPDEDPADAFDRQWVRTLLDDAVQELRAELEGSGKAAHFACFAARCLEPNVPVPGEASSRRDGEASPSSDPSRPPSYQELAERHGIKVNDVKNWLRSCRKSLRRILEARILDYVTSPEELEAELLAVLAG